MTDFIMNFKHFSVKEFDIIQVYIFNMYLLNKWISELIYLQIDYK